MFLIKYKIPQVCESAVLFHLSSNIINVNCEVNLFYNMTTNTVISDAGDTLLLSNLDKTWYLHCNKHNIVSIPIPANDHTAINKYLLCDCKLEGGNELLHEYLASCSIADEVDRNMYFTINKAFSYDL